MLRDYLQLHFIVFLWGFTAISGLWLSLTPLPVVLYRTLLAALGMWWLLRSRGIALPRERSAVMRMLLTGGLVAAHWFLFFASARVANASVCLVGLASAAFWTSLLEPLIARRAWRWYELLLGSVVVGAMYAISQFETEPRYVIGLLMGVGSALGASLFTIINGQFTQKHHHFAITFYEMCGAFVFSLLLYYPLQVFWYQPQHFLPDAAGSPWGAWAYLFDGINLLFLAGVCTVYAYSASVELMRRIPPFAVNLSVNLEPVYGMVLAGLLFGEWEEMTAGFYWSAAVILACVLAYPLLKGK